MVSGNALQLIGVGVITGSVIVLALFPVIALLWNSFVRPTEEDVLQHLFGRNFELYRTGVRAWLADALYRGSHRRSSARSRSPPDIPDSVLQVGACWRESRALPQTR